MKNVFLGLSLLLILANCNSDFKTGAPYKEVTVVFGLLNHADYFNYIKVTRGFFDESKDNLLLAQNPDSIYFKDLSVVIEEYEGSNRTAVFQLAKVDLNNEGFPKPEGVFANSPNWGYKLSANLNPFRMYKLIVKNNETGKIVTGTTEVITTDDLYFRFVKPFTNADQIVVGDLEGKYDYSWKAPKEGTFYDLSMRFHYVEKNLSTGVKTRKYVDLPLKKNIDRTGTEMAVKVNNTDFYSLLNANIGAVDNNTQRFVDTPDIRIIAGNDILKTYIDVNNSQGGITNDQIQPSFTTLEGEDILGIFSTRAVKTLSEVPFTEESFNFIIFGSATRSLGFVGKTED